MKAVLTFLLLCCALQAPGQAPQSQSGHEHHAGTVESRGDMAMDFPHDKTTHHFLLCPDGGAIQVTANDPSDSEDIAAIRMHLRHISRMFPAGDFSAPMFIHDRVPPGVPTLKKAKDAVSYKFEETSSGAKVRIQTSDKEALKAVHDFLRFQIADHHTGDTTTVSNSGQPE